ncbi:MULTISPECIES: GrpB family protein [Pseudoalteromonas]|uniref:GrpB family protein n=1 Tax=Pseudoalteromonas obscura TaxID=3048491 RepID=A0ABT7ELT2_9GAMM|nr:MULTISPECIES: GrpB family protein [Pseudoalteromonas]MBQ4838052.1 GrpB family protein [Pseudoalteromonas luteoviolacea]MDK2596006.1 GrpB family protein [Pseudoalteromonas sp. P94(2023)]
MKIELFDYEPTWLDKFEIERIKFRDRLRGNRALADPYAQLKLSLAQNNRDNREAFTREKWPFIQNVLEL